jgi:hypothetical protein
VVKRQGLTLLMMLGCLVLMFSVRTQALAVWPPSTTLEEESQEQSPAKADNDIYRTLPRPRGIVDRLEEDTRRLERALTDLREDEKQLKQSSETNHGFSGESK